MIPGRIPHFDALILRRLQSKNQCTARGVEPLGLPSQKNAQCSCTFQTRFTPKPGYRKLGCASAPPQWIKGRLLLEHRNQHPEKSIGDAAEGSGVLVAGSS
jgi:hypothetical protein